MNRVTIVGRVSKAEGRPVGQDSYMLKFSVAADRRAKVDGRWDKLTEWFDCVLWGKRGLSLEPYVTKGTQVTVLAERETREHDGRRYFDYRVHELVLQGGSGGDRHPDPRPPSRSPGHQGAFGPDDSDIPF